MTLWNWCKECMMNELTLFNFDGKAVRTLGTFNDPWFVAADVCEILGLSDVSQAVERLRPYAKGTCIVGTLGGQQEMLIVSEPGLYALIFTSRKEEAVKFQDWVFTEVLPQIRKTGKYDPQTVREYLELEDKSKVSPLLVKMHSSWSYAEDRLLDMEQSRDKCRNKYSDLVEKIRMFALKRTKSRQAYDKLLLEFGLGTDDEQDDGHEDYDG